MKTLKLFWEDRLDVILKIVFHRNHVVMLQSRQYDTYFRGAFPTVADIHCDECKERVKGPLKGRVLNSKKIS